MKVGFVGLGVMGSPMALNIVKGGHELTVYDRSAEAVARLTDAGAKAATSAREVGAASDIVVTMLPEPQHVEQVVLGDDGVAQGLRAGGIVIDMSTIDPITSKRVGDELRRRGFEMVDSPVGKTSEHAATGTLTLMVGGNQAAIERVTPVLNCMGTDTFYCGGPGTGHAMKMTNNLLATTIMIANTEALAIGIKAGLKLELMQEVMRTTMAWNQQLAVAMPKKVFVGDDSPGFAIRLACKDVRLACEAAEAMGFEAKVGRGAHATMESAISMGLGDRDTAALMFILEKKLGIEVRQHGAAGQDLSGGRTPWLPTCSTTWKSPTRRCSRSTKSSRPPRSRSTAGASSRGAGARKPSKASGRQSGWSSWSFRASSRRRRGRTPPNMRLRSGCVSSARSPI